ncbi:hypothetical protein [Flammeovirga sp. SJP92]|uniref:hypothetical protein n=1 Tax=Flammeovirga sp. SJP92 TaxID=1775430 RepID=UPI0007884EC6|nr:hypothetical protein [Flammeovirga sp. SJP92]KXX67805.1 hypothetical protein AVL50_25420 [Flammeovirga sp. SJP92]
MRLERFDDYSLSSVDKVLIPWLGEKMNFWYELESGRQDFTKNQKKSLNHFLSIASSSYKKKFNNKLLSFIEMNISNGNLNNKFDSQNLVNWKESEFFVPILNRSSNRFVFLLLELNVMKKESNFNLEIEVIFKNENILLIEEMKGLWMLDEWTDFYLK